MISLLLHLLSSRPEQLVDTEGRDLKIRNEGATCDWQGEEF